MTPLEQAFERAYARVAEEKRAARAVLDAHRYGTYHVTLSSLAAARRRSRWADADMYLLATIERERDEIAHQARSANAASERTPREQLSVEVSVLINLLAFNYSPDFSGYEAHCAIVYDKAPVRPLLEAIGRVYGAAYEVEKAEAQPNQHTEAPNADV